MKHKAPSRQKRPKQNSLVVLSSTPYFTKRGQLPKISRQPSPQQSPSNSPRPLSKQPRQPRPRLAETYLSQLRLIKQQARQQVNNLREQHQQQLLQHCKNTSASRDLHRLRVGRATEFVMEERRRAYRKYRHVCDKRCPRDCRRAEEEDKVVASMTERDGEAEEEEEDQVRMEHLEARFVQKFELLREELLPFKQLGKQHEELRQSILGDLVEFENLAKQINLASGEERLYELAKNDQEFVLAIKRSLRGLRAFPQVCQAMKRQSIQSACLSPRQSSNRCSAIITKVLSDIFRNSLTSSPSSAFSPTRNLSNFAPRPHLSSFSKSQLRAPSLLRTISKLATPRKQSEDLLEDLEAESELVEERTSLRSNSHSGGRRTVVANSKAGRASRMDRVSKFGAFFARKKNSNLTENKENNRDNGKAAMLPVRKQASKQGVRNGFAKKRIKRVISDLNLAQVRNQFFPGSYLIRHDYFDFISQGDSQQQDSQILDQQILFAGQSAQFYRERALRSTIAYQTIQDQTCPIRQSDKIRQITIQPQQTLAQIKHALWQLFTKKGNCKKLKKYRKYFSNNQKNLKQKLQCLSQANQDIIQHPDSDFSWCHSLNFNLQILDTITLKLQLESMEKQYMETQPIQNIACECEGSLVGEGGDLKEMARKLGFEQESRLLSRMVKVAGSEEVGGGLVQRDLYRGDRLSYNSRMLQKRRR